MIDVVLEDDLNFKCCFSQEKKKKIGKERKTINGELAN